MPKYNKTIPTCHPERKHEAKGLCVSCYNKQVNPEREKEYRARDVQRARENPEKVRFNRIKYFYGISKDEFLDRLKSQNGLCAICKTNKASCVDHDHQSEKVRGILCNGCNSGIGLFKEDVNVLENALNYLLDDNAFRVRYNTGEIIGFKAWPPTP